VVLRRERTLDLGMSLRHLLFPEARRADKLSAVARVDPTWHALPVEEVLRAFSTGPDGLTEAEARERLARPAWTKPAARQQASQPAAASPPITLPCSRSRPSAHGRAYGPGLSRVGRSPRP
jgi:hypothetical protein